MNTRTLFISKRERDHILKALQTGLQVTKKCHSANSRTYDLNVVLDKLGLLDKNLENMEQSDIKKYECLRKKMKQIKCHARQLLQCDDISMEEMRVIIRNLNIISRKMKEMSDKLGTQRFTFDESAVPDSSTSIKKIKKKIVPKEEPKKKATLDPEVVCSKWYRKKLNGSNIEGNKCVSRSRFKLNDIFSENDCCFQNDLLSNSLSTIDQNIDRSIKQNIDRNIKQNIDRTIEPTVDRNIEQNIDGNVDQNIEQNIDRTVVQTVDRNIKQNIDRNIDQNIEKNIDRTIKPTVDRNIERTVAVVSKELDDNDGSLAQYSKSNDHHHCFNGLILETCSKCLCRRWSIPSVNGDTLNTYVKKNIKNTGNVTRTNTKNVKNTKECSHSFCKQPPERRKDDFVPLPGLVPSEREHLADVRNKIFKEGSCYSGAGPEAYSSSGCCFNSNTELEIFETSDASLNKIDWDEVFDSCSSEYKGATHHFKRKIEGNTEWDGERSETALSSEIIIDGAKKKEVVLQMEEQINNDNDGRTQNDFDKEKKIVSQMVTTSEGVTKSERVDKSVSAGKSEKVENSEKVDKSESTDRYERAGKIDKALKSKTPDKFERTGISEIVDKTVGVDKSQKVDKSETADSYEKVGKFDRASKSKRPDKFERAGRSESVERPERVEKSVGVDKAKRAGKFERAGRSESVDLVKSERVDKSVSANKSEYVEKSQKLDKSGSADKFGNVDKSEAVDMTKMAGMFDRTSKYKLTDNFRKAGRSGRVDKSESVETIKREDKSVSVNKSERETKGTQSEHPKVNRGTSYDNFVLHPQFSWTMPMIGQAFRRSIPLVREKWKSFDKSGKFIRPTKPTSETGTTTKKPKHTLVRDRSSQTNDMLFTKNNQQVMYLNVVYTKTHLRYILPDSMERPALPHTPKVIERRAIDNGYAVTTYKADSDGVIHFTLAYSDGDKVKTEGPDLPAESNRRLHQLKSLWISSARKFFSQLNEKLVGESGDCKYHHVWTHNVSCSTDYASSFCSLSQECSDASMKTNSTDY